MSERQFAKASPAMKPDVQQGPDSIGQNTSHNIGPRKTVHQAPVLNFEYPVEQLLNRADQDIEVGLFSIAKSTAEEVLAREPGNCHALMICLMADYEVQEIEQFKEKTVPMNSNPYFQRIMDTKDSTYIKYLTECNRVICSKLNIHWEDDLNKARYKLSKAVTVRDVIDTERILSAIPSYPEADEFRNECFRAKGELTEATYQMAKQKMADMEWAEAYDLFESIESYKNSKIQMIECKEGMKKEELYRAAMEQENQGKFQDAGAAFEQLKDYRDSKRHALKNRRLVHGNKVRAIGKKHTGAAFANIALSSFYSLGCCVSFPNNILINLLWGIPLMIAAVVLTIVRSRYRPTKRMWTMMGVTFSAFVVLAACGAITYGFSDSVFSSLFYLLATAAIIL